MKSTTINVSISWKPGHRLWKLCHQPGNGVEMMKFRKTNHSVTYTKYNHVLLTYLPGKSVGVSSAFRYKISYYSGQKLTMS